MPALDPEMHLLVNAGETIANLPSPFSQVVNPDDLRDIWIVPFTTVSTPNDVHVSSGIAFDRPVVASIPGLDALELVIGGVGDATIFEFEIGIRPSIRVTIKDVRFSLRFRSDYFKPARFNAATNAFELDPTKPFVEVELGTVTLSFDADAGIELSLNQAISLAPIMIGESGVVIEASDLRFFLSDASTPPGRPTGTRGVGIGSAKVSLPGSLGRSVTLSMTDGFIGNGGLSGTVAATISPPVDEDFGGVAVALDAVSLKFAQNALLESTLTGTMVVPYFDKRVSVEVTVGLDGRLGIAVTGVAPGQGTYDPTTGIVSLATGPLTFNLTRLALELSDGNAIFHAAGRVQAQVAGLTLPSFEIQDFSIDRHGTLTLKGGWINLPNQLSLDLFGFVFEITKIGFGTLEDGRRWVGFSGGLKLVDGLSAGASVDGMRILWDAGNHVSLSLEGVGVDLEIPNVLVLKGAVSLRDREFRGAVKVVLSAINFAVDGQFVAGTLPSGKKYFAIYVHAELPAGIPLGATGLALYGMAGLYAHDMEPDKRPNEGWYQNPDQSDGWYLRTPPGSIGAGVENLAKWRGSAGHMGFGAGITLGTFVDNGFTFNGRVLLALVFPGPVIIIEGKANLFRKRSSLEGDDPLFRALAIIEPGKSFQLDLDARYRYKSGGELLDMAGSAEAFFNFRNASQWHVWLGFRDDPNRRIRARAFQLFDVGAYFMLDSHELDVGVSWSFDKSWGFKVLNVHVSASLEAAASVSWHPSHFSGSVSLRGRAELRAFGHGVGLSVGASILGEVFDPLHLRGDFEVGIDLPWPLPDIGVGITLEWGGSLASPPPLPLPLQEVSAEISNRALRWPFRRGVNLLPSYDQGDLEFTSGGAPGSSDFSFDRFLVVPVDAQVGFTFSRPTDDPANVGNNPTVVKPEVVGDPVTGSATGGYTVGYTLTSVVLEKLAPVAPSETPGSPLPAGQEHVGWVAVAQKGSVSGGTLPPIFGSWTPAGPPQMPDAQRASDGVSLAQSKLMLYAKSPFEYTSLASSTWDDWFSEANPSYPCPPFHADQKFVVVFDPLIGATVLPKEIKFDSPPFDVRWQYGGDITENDEVVEGLLGPIHKGLRIIEIPLEDTGLSSSLIRVTPPPGLPEVHVRVGTPAVFKPFGQFGQFVFGLDPLDALDGTLGIKAFKFDANGQRDYNVDPPRNVMSAGHQGMLVPFSVQLEPAEPALGVHLEIFAEEPIEVGFAALSAAAEVRLFDSQGAEILAAPEQVGFGSSTVRLTAQDIAQIVVTALSGVVLVERILARTPVTALARVGTSNTFVGPFVEQDGLVVVKGTDLGTIYFATACGGQWTMLELSIPSRLDEIIRHIVQSLEQFNQKGPVFEPETQYRLTVRTRRKAQGRNPETAAVAATDDFVEQAYFRTSALPGVGVPAAPEGTQSGDPNQPPVTGFEDLGFYVKRTVPVVPPPAGGHRTPARAVYRAYDANVEFKTETPYVELMYRLGRRDLTLRIFDANNQPVRSASGRVILTGAKWGQSDDPTLSSSTQRWIGMVNAAACRPTPPFDDQQAVRSEVMVAPSEEMVLAPETLHQARLVPLLLHETWVNARSTLAADGQGFRLDGWHAENSGTVASKWFVRSETVTGPAGSVTIFYVAESTGASSSSLVYEGPLASVGATGHRDHPLQWTDLRASVQLRWPSGTIGLELRRGSAGLLRVTLTRSGGQAVAVQLVSFVGTARTVLGDATVSIRSDADTTLVVDCVGSHVDVFELAIGEQPAQPIITTDAAPTFAGTVALFTDGATNPRFSDVEVHDLRSDPSVAYAFDFITSKYTDFRHHLGSFDDQLFAAPTTLGLTAADVAARDGAAVSVPAAQGSSPGLGLVGDAERRAFEDLEQKTLGPAALHAPEAMEVFQASRDPAMSALLVRSPEPIVWERTQLVVATRSQAMQRGIPGDVKLTSVAFATTPTDESVTLLVRRGYRLAQHRVEFRALPDATNSDPKWTTYYAFGDEAPVGDGEEVLLLSGDASSDPPRAPGTTHRFVADDPSEVSLHFAAPGVELRLLAPDGKVIHQGQFLTDDRFTPVEMRTIRKPDGTAFFLYPPPAAGPLTASGWRLRFTFARSAGTSFPVLRQAGDATPEIAVLDVGLD